VSLRLGLEKNPSHPKGSIPIAVFYWPAGFMQSRNVYNVTSVLAAKSKRTWDFLRVNLCTRGSMPQATVPFL